MDEHPADELFRRALIDADASAAVALRVTGLPLCEALTVVFHGRRDLGTIQTYVAHGGRGAGTAVAADELLRVPCDLDLAEAEDRDEAEHLYAEQATAMRDALAAADTVLDIWREPLEDLAQSRVGLDRRIGLEVRLPGAPAAAGGAGRRPTRASSSPRSAPRARWPRASPRWGSPAHSRTSPASTRCPTTLSAASRTSSTTPPSTRAAWGSSSAARSSPCAASSSCRARGSKRPPRTLGRL